MKTHSSLSEANGSGLLTQLLNRGDRISVFQGVLSIKPNSGREVPFSWLKQNEPLIINDICRLFNVTPLKYISYSTGRYGSKKTEGITLQFINLQTNKQVYLIFNVSLKRVRKSKGGNKGDPLPGKQFIVSERSSFYKFWCLAGLPLPKSLSKFYECMGKLKPLIFTGEVDINNRIIAKKAPLFEVTHQQILERNNLTLNSNESINLTAKEPLIFRQETAKEPLSFTAKHIELGHTSIGLSPNQSTCTSKYGNTVIRKEVISKGANTVVTPINTLKNKQIDKNTNGAISQNKRPEDQTTNEWLEDWEKCV